MEGSSGFMDDPTKGIPDDHPRRPMGFFETDQERKDRKTKLFQFFFPWVLFLIIAICTVSTLTIWKGWDAGRELINIWIFYTLPPAGKETLIPKAVTSGVPGLMAGLTTSSVDICVSLFLIWNYDWVKKLPVIGPGLERTESKGREKVKKTKWFGKATFLLTTFVVFVPFSGSGGFGGTVFGRVVGLHPYRVLMAVAIGSTIGSTGFAVLSETLADFLGSDNTFIYFLSNLNILQLVAVIITLTFLVYTVRNPKKAAVTTTRVVGQALDVTDKALEITHRKQKEAKDLVKRGTKESFGLMREGNRVISDISMDLATRPMVLLGKDGRRIREDTRNFSARQVERAHDLADNALVKTMEFGDKASSGPIEFAAALTREGLKETKAGWEHTGRVLIKGGENLESFYERKRMDRLNRIKKGRRGNGGSDNR